MEGTASEYPLGYESSQAQVVSEFGWGRFQILSLGKGEGELQLDQMLISL